MVTDPGQEFRREAGGYGTQISRKVLAYAGRVLNNDDLGGLT